jgi:thymidylate synthase (FAD)
MTRPHSPALDAILGQSFPVLDHGFIRVIDYMGDDAAIEQAARVSYAAGTRRVSETRDLLRYLMRHRHSTPFEMCEIKFHIRLPIFVARQWIRHRTANVNEHSARYSEMPDQFHIPAAKDLAQQSATNLQGRGEPLSVEDVAAVLRILYADARRCHDDYQTLMNKHHLSRELARINLPIGAYTEWFWKIDLHNLFHFLSLRADHHAQWEIRQYADVMLDIVQQWVPIATEAFDDYRRNAVTLSAQAAAVMRRRLAGETVTQETSGMGRREWAEYLEAFA